MKKHYKFYNCNNIGRDFVVGDIHGCYNELIVLLTEVSFNTNTDRLFSVGDLVDRGPDSDKILRLLLHKPWFVPIKGNHEILMQFSHSTENDRTNWGMIFVQNGGKFLADDIRDEVISEIINLPYMIEIETKSGRRVGLIHAQVPPSYDDWNNLKEDIILSDVDHQQKAWMGPLHEMVWGRKRFDKYKAQQDKKRVYADIKNIDEIFVGHTIVPNPVKYEKHHFIDTGAFLPYWLSDNSLKRMKKSKGIDNPRLTCIEIK